MGETIGKEQSSETKIRQIENIQKRLKIDRAVVLLLGTMADKIEIDWQIDEMIDRYGGENIVVMADKLKLIAGKMHILLTNGVWIEPMDGIEDGKGKDKAIADMIAITDCKLVIGIGWDKQMIEKYNRR